MSGKINSGDRFVKCHSVPVHLCCDLKIQTRAPRIVRMIAPKKLFWHQKL